MGGVEMNEKRGPWYLITGVVFGLLIGLFYARVVAPVKYVDVGPDVLTNELSVKYRSMIALAYQANGDLGRAKARLVLLNDDDVIKALSAQAQRIVADGGPRHESDALATLADDIREDPELPVAPTPDEDSSIQDQTQIAVGPSATLALDQTIRTATLEPTLTFTPMATFTPRPTQTPYAALDFPFVLDEREDVCDPGLPQGLLQIQVEDENGQPVPGARVNVTWEDGDEYFYTGLYPQVSMGYADFSMIEDTEYRLRVGKGGEVVDSLIASECGDTDEDDGEEVAYLGGYWLKFSP